MASSLVLEICSMELPLLVIHCLDRSPLAKERNAKSIVSCKYFAKKSFALAVIKVKRP